MTHANACSSIDKLKAFHPLADDQIAKGHGRRFAELAAPIFLTGQLPSTSKPFQNKL